MLLPIDCPCQSPSSSNRDSAFRDLKALRSSCPALKKILLPDNIWPDIERKVREGFDKARHWPITLNALFQGYLGRVTAPFHRYLLVDGDVDNKVTTQYRVDLVEKWICEQTPLERHRKSRIFQGKLAELLSATWIENQGWKVTGLEALGARFDIEAVSLRGVSSSIEVKHIGEEDNRFQELLEDLSSGNSVTRPWDPNEAYDYFLFAVYTAAKKLVQSSMKRLAFIIISNMAWDFFDPLIKDGLAERPYIFLDSGSTRWKQFLTLKKQEARFSAIDADLDAVIGQLTELWIIREGNDMRYSLESTCKYE